MSASPSIPSHVDLLAAREELALLKRNAEIVKDFGLLAYKPHAKQDAFHRAGAYKSRYVRTGNRFGKSTMGAAEDCAWALGYRPWYSEGDPARYVGIPQRSVKILIIVADWDKAEEIFTNQVEGEGKGKLMKLLPKSEIVQVIKNQSGRIAEIQVKSKWGGISSIHLDTIRSYKSNPMGQESSNWDAIHVDEPLPEDMYLANARGLMDSDGSEWFTCTPITEMWINDKFLPKGNFRDIIDKGIVTEQDIEGTIVTSWMITGSTHDNPCISESAKARYIASLSAEDRETRIGGRPAHLTGAIYKEFQPEIHIPQKLMSGWPDWSTPPPNYCIRVAIDTHPSTPHAVLFVATSPSGHSFFYHEIFEKVYVGDLALSIKARLDGRDPLRVLLEQAAYNDDPFDGVTMADEFIKVGLPVEAAVKDLQYGIQRVKQELNKRDNNGYPLLNFSPELHWTKREFDRYCWDPKTGKPRDKDDHLMECLYRLVITGLEYIPPEQHTVRVVHKANNSNLDLSLPKNLTKYLPASSARLPSYKTSRYRSGDARYASRN